MNLKKALFVILMLSLSLHAGGKPTKVLLLSHDTFPPFSYIKNEKNVGIDVDIVKEMAKRLKIKIEIRLVPWKRLLHFTEKGLCDGSFSLFRTPERETFALYANSEPIHKSNFAVFVKKGKEFKFNNLKDLYGKTVGIDLGFSVSTEFDLAVKEGKIKIEEASTPETNIKKTILGRFDAYVSNIIVTRYHANKMGVPDKIVALPKEIKKGHGAFFVISKAGKITNKKKMLEKINETLKAMAKDGTYKRIINKYIHNSAN